MSVYHHPPQKNVCRPRERIFAGTALNNSITLSHYVKQMRDATDG